MKRKVIFVMFLFIEYGLMQVQAQKTKPFTDSRDGNTYKTIQIGNQIWMAENLKYLPSVDSSAVGSETNPHYYVYNYNGTNVKDAKVSVYYKTYGVLYNWCAAMNIEISTTESSIDEQMDYPVATLVLYIGPQGICPSGWHLPSDYEWAQLIDYLGGEEFAGGRLKEIDTIYWNPNIDATNESRFSALPGGGRGGSGGFSTLGNYGFWWSATEIDDAGVWIRSLNSNDGNVGRGFNNKDVGFSVRCLKNY